MEALGNVYDHPEYFELLFQDETSAEADFVEAASRQYCTGKVRRILEPGCGGGRLSVELAGRGYQVTCFDQSRPALEFLQKRLLRRRLQGHVFCGDLADFRVGRPMDVVACTFNTFRHLLTEQAAESHLNCIARALRRGGIYILGFHLLPLDVDESCIERWTARRGKTRVTAMLRVLSTDRRRRLEQIRISMSVHRGERHWKTRTEFPLRMYTAAQFRRLLRRVPAFEVCDVFDFWYDIETPLRLNDEITDTVFILRKT